MISKKRKSVTVTLTFGMLLMQITLHDSHEVPVTTELGVAVAPGFQINMALQKATVSHMTSSGPRLRYQELLGFLGDVTSHHKHKLAKRCV